MPYALVATDGRLFAGFANGQLWESRDRGELGRIASRGNTSRAVLALATTGS